MSTIARRAKVDAAKAVEGVLDLAIEIHLLLGRLRRRRRLVGRNPHVPVVQQLAALKQSEVMDLVETIVVDPVDGGLPAAPELTSPFHLIVLLVSPSMLVTEFCQRGGVDRLLRCHEERDIVLIPVILQPMAWQRMKLGKLQVLPAGGRPLSTWPTADEGYADVVAGIRGVIAKLPARVVVSVAERGDWHAKFWLAVCYSLGCGVSKNAEKAAEWMEKAAQAGEDPATMWIAATVLEKRDPERALMWMERSANAGHGPAMNHLGQWYECGTWVHVDPGKAYQWRVRAAEHGQVDAMLHLARLCFDGIGTPADDAEGTAWLARAAGLGMPLAMVHLGNSYCLGRGVAVDMAKAHEWWRRAAASGNEEAIQTLQQQGFEG